MAENVVRLEEIDPSQIALVGGKAASLAALTRVDGIDVPPGFCVTTTALAADRIAPDVAEQITIALAQLGEHQPVAVRSSATAEDLPGASFAGQYETYLDVVGAGEVLAAIGRCRASLDSERAVAYRERSAVDTGPPRMAVIVQRMVPARVSGVMFTADPVSSRRTVLAIEAGAGLADQLVSGHGDPERWTVSTDGQLTRTDGAETLLSDAQVHELARLGRRISARFGAPQDIEWCLADDGFRFVQSRPITTLFPVPETGDDDFHLYVSVGHQQMMTDAMRPFGISMWQLTTPRPMAVAGGRLFVDIAQDLRSPARLAAHVDMLGRSDPLLGDALRTILARGEILTQAPADGEPEKLPRWADPAPLLPADPALVTELIEARQASVATAAREIAPLTGPALLEFIRSDLEALRRLLFEPRSSQVIMAGMRAAWWLTEHLQQWLGDSSEVDTLTKSLSHNITAEMGLALLDVADEIRPHPEVVALLRAVHDDEFLRRLPALPGGEQARAAIERYLDVYGMRCEGEIDITRPRWAERPSMLLPMLLADVDGFEPGAARRRFAQGLEEAQRAREEILARVRRLPDGELKAAESEAMIDRIRAFAGYREYPKYGMISRYLVYKRALMGEAVRLVAAGVIDEPDDIFFLDFEELEDVVRSGRADRALIQARRDRYRRDEPLIPPRVMTSDGEILAGSYRRDDLPAGALPGLAVSGGIVEGRARVILDVGHAELAPGDVLVTTFTDPSWTPVFVAIAGLVTEVGGLMTHGAVIAREYGLPAVVGVQDATRLIQDGQRIRVHGGDGYVELLDPPRYDGAS